jgi:methyl-accepting chemotaxis protein
VFKELDYATNVVGGKYKDAGLGVVVQGVLNSSDPEFVIFDDFKPYSPSHGAPASFIARSLVDADGEKMGVFVLQMPIDWINATMQVSAGLGETGETFIIGSDFLVCNDSRFGEGGDILKVRIENEAVSAALSGETGNKVLTAVTPGNEAARETWFAYEPMEFQGTT